MLTYRDFAYAISPPWLRRFYGERFVGVVWGLMADLTAEALSQAARVANLRSGFQPPDALGPIGSERSMPRYRSDTDATYRERLAEAWDTWMFGGNESSIIGQEETAFEIDNVVVIPATNSDDRPERPAWDFEWPPTIQYSGSLTYNDNNGGGDSEITEAGVDFPALGFYDGGKVLVSGTTLNDGYYHINASAGSVAVGIITLDGIVLADEGPVASDLDATNWSRFAVVVEQVHPWTSWTFGGGVVYGSGATYGSTLTVDDIISIKSIIRKWKAGHAINPRIYIIISGDYYGDPDLVFGGGEVYAAGTICAIDHQV